MEPLPHRLGLARRGNCVKLSATTKKSRCAAAHIFRKVYSEVYPCSCIGPSRLGPSHAHCSLCNSDFSVQHGGKDDCHHHTESAKHKSCAKLQLQNNCIAESCVQPNVEHTLRVKKHVSRQQDCERFPLRSQQDNGCYKGNGSSTKIHPEGENEGNPIHRINRRFQRHACEAACGCRLEEGQPNERSEWSIAVPLPTSLHGFPRDHSP